jgi:RNA polymerase sigma-70 factor (ECF subfamily)
MLTRLLGAQHLALAEDAVQDAFVTALGHWPRSGVPDDPRAWLLQVARRKALDHLRREGTAERAAPELERALADNAGSNDVSDEVIADDQLRMMFLCVHQAISAESRVALTLKTVCGLSVGEIAQAFLADEAAIAQRLVRAKRALRDAGAQFELPDGDALAERRNAVLDVLYLMFTAGHSAFEGGELIRDDIAREALRLSELLALAPVTTAPETHALAALICLHSARFPARLDANGEFVRLADQDRSRWESGLIARGFQHLERAAEGSTRSNFHIEAELAAVHAAAASWRDTDWSRIVELYDAMLERAASPVVALNRVVALRELRGPEAALAEFHRVAAEPALRNYSLLHSVHADLLEDLGKPNEAHSAWSLALEGARAEPLRRYLARRLAGCGQNNVDSRNAAPS